MLLFANPQGQQQPSLILAQPSHNRTTRGGGMLALLASRKTFGAKHRNFLKVAKKW